MAFQNFYTKNDPNCGWRAGALFIYTPALPPSQMYGGSAPMPPLTVRPCGFPQSVVTPGEIKPPAAAPGAAARICPATTPKRRQWRKQQGVVGAALQYLQGHQFRRKYWLSARDPAPPRHPTSRSAMAGPAVQTVRLPVCGTTATAVCQGERAGPLHPE